MKSSTSRLGTTSPARRRLALATVGAFAMASLVACGGGGEAAEEPNENQISVEEVPDYYPDTYADEVIEASKDEGGELTIYSNTSEENWAPIFRDFQKKFPWIEKVSANDLDSDEVF